MVNSGKVFQNIYRDSIALMRVANDLSQVSGVGGLEILLGTPANLEILRSRGMCPPEIAGATVNDIVVVVLAENPSLAKEVLKEAEIRLFEKQASGSGRRKSFVSLDAVIRKEPGANLVLLSIPGPFVRKEALAALYKGLNVMIFSDNVPLKDEIEIKQEARSRGLLVMGPDCGTAIIGGIGLGFANQVARGPIGIVGASGTGIQEVSCLLDRAGMGVSHCIGTGSNDVKEEVGGITFLLGIDILERDPRTSVIVLLSKPPAPAVEAKLLERIAHCRKPVVVNFQGRKSDSFLQAGATPVKTLEEAALMALQKAGLKEEFVDDFEGLIAEQVTRLAKGQKYIRGLFSGGTLAIETALILQEYGAAEVAFNAKHDQLPLLEDPRRSVGHTCVDLGDDVFTAGKPHPMLDPLMRRDRILKEAADPETAALLLDFVLGFGVHPAPVETILNTLNQARKTAADGGRNLVIVTAVCGTDQDPQGRSQQVKLLRENECLVFESNAQAARFAARLLKALNDRGERNG